MSDPQTASTRPGDPLDLATSVAGEEDPGASIDLAASPGRGAPPAGQPAGAQAPLRPGDEAPDGTPGTGENVCRRCGGSGRLGAADCPTCLGTGKVTAGIGGA